MGDTSKRPFDPDVEAAQLAIRLVRSLEATHRKLEVAQSFARIVANVAQGHAAVYGERILRAAHEAKQAATVLAVRAAERHVFGDEATASPPAARSGTTAGRRPQKEEPRGETAERRRRRSDGVVRGKDRGRASDATDARAAGPQRGRTRLRRSATGDAGPPASRARSTPASAREAEGAIPTPPDSAVRDAGDTGDTATEPASRKRAIA